MYEDLEKKLNLECISFESAGSRVTCNPPPTNTDKDYICLVSDVLSFVLAKSDEGFEVGGSIVYDYLEKHGNEFGFVSMVFDDVNLIITGNEDFYKKFLIATKCAKRLNLLDKSDRIALFQAILYGNA